LKYPPIEINQTNQLNIQQSNLNQKYVFETFVVGNSNRQAISAAQAISTELNSVRFNPFFIYGGSGFGKTHLAQAIGNCVLRNHPSKRLLYVSSEQFMIDFLEQVNSNDFKKKADFNQAYRNVDLLIVDDIQFLSGKSGTQDKFFHIFNSLYLSGKQIILTADKAPKDIKDIDDRLISRFISGLNIEIGQPDLKLRKDIIRRKSSAEGTILSEEIVEYIAKNVTKSVREIEGILIKLILMTSLDYKPLTLEMVQEVVFGLASEAKPLTVEEIKAKVASYYNVGIELMESKSRKHNIALARQMAMYFSRKLTNASLKAIAKCFGGRNHATVLHSYQVIENYIATDKQVKSEYDALESFFNDR
jgi:chromosomal replication initiator protein